MEVRLIKHWGGWKPGRVFCGMPDGQARELIKRGSAVEASTPAEIPRKASQPAKKCRRH